MRHWPWAVLGIDATNDVSAVRSGYAGVLKSFDPDDDPDRYAALRQARDYALDMARAGTALDEPVEDENWEEIDWDDDAAEAGDGGAAYAACSPARGSAAPDRNTPAQTVIDAHYAAIADLLNPDENREYPPLPEEAETMRRHCAALLADPRMDTIAFRANADDHFLYLLADSVPRSDAILPMVADHFGWQKRRRRIGQPAMLDWLLDHNDQIRSRSPLFDAETAQFRAALEDPTSENYRIWRDLTGGSGEQGTARAPSAKRVMALLQTIEHYYHPLMRAVDPLRLAYWQWAAARAQRRKNRWIMAGCFAFMLLALSMNRLFPDSPDAHKLPVSTFAEDRLTTPEADLDRAAGLIDRGASVADIQTRNPGLYALLLAQWQRAQAKGTPAMAFINSTATFLHGLFPGNLIRAPRADITEYWRLELVRTRLVKALGPDRCARYVKGAMQPPPLPFAEAQRMRLLELRLLSEVPYAAPKQSSARRYTIPGDIVMRSATRVGLTIATFGAALRGQGPPGTPCDARIGLIETVIATPGKVGDTLLRTM